MVCSVEEEGEVWHEEIYKSVYRARFLSAAYEAVDTLVKGDRLQVTVGCRVVNYTYSDYMNCMNLESSTGILINPVDVIKVNGQSKVFGDMDETLVTIMEIIKESDDNKFIKVMVMVIDDLYRKGGIYMHEDDWKTLEEVVRGAIT